MFVVVWIAAAFAIAAAITGLTRASATVVGCLMPTAAALLAIIYVLFVVAAVASNSTAPVFIPFAAILTVAGSVPGAIFGQLLRKKLSLKRTRTD